MIAINHIENRSLWDDFVIKNNHDTFLQSWSWGEFNLSLGNKIWRLGLYYQDALIAVLLVLKIKAKRGSFLFVPHGPIFEKFLLEETDGGGSFKNEAKIRELLKTTRDQLVKIAIGEDCSFIRVAPTLKKSADVDSLFKDLGLINAPIHIHSELSWVLNIQKDEDTILKEMRKTTRYLIRQKDKFGIRVQKSDNASDIEKFYKIYKETEKRQKFVAYDLNYLTREFEAFSKNNSASLYFAYYKDELLGGAFIIKTGRSGFSHHIASILKYSNVPISYVLQWEIIKDLKNQDISFYNFWGIAPSDKPNHPWRGITLFKMGFGGEAKAYLHTKDYVIKYKYWINWLIETLRRIKRKY